MRACTSNIHHKFYPGGWLLPDKEFESDHRSGYMAHCRKCREYKRDSSNRKIKRKYKKRASTIPSPYDDLCESCVSSDCIRENGQDTPAHDTKYLNRCVLAVARHFNLDTEGADEQIFVRRLTLRWQHLADGK